MGKKVVLTDENRAELLREARMLADVARSLVADITADAALGTIRQDIEGVSVLARRLAFIASKRGERSGIRREDGSAR